MGIRLGLRPGLQWLAGLACVFALSVLLISCGKKTPPRLPVPEKPDAPQDLSALHREEGIILRWRYPGDAAALEGFVVMRALDGGFQKLAETNSPMYLDRDFQTGVAYRYKVLAESLKGVLSDDSPVLDVLPMPVPPPPGDVSAGIAREGIVLSWQHPWPVGTVGFNIYRSHTLGQYPLSPLNPEPVEGRSFVDPEVPGAAVFYTVRAVSGDGIPNESGPSAGVEVSPGDFVPSRVTGLEAVVVKDGVMLIWGDSPESWVSGYRLYRAREGGEFSPAGTSSTPAFKVQGLPAERTLFVVNAVGPGVEGPPSEAVAVSPGK